MNIRDDRVKQSSTYELHEFKLIDEDDDTYEYTTTVWDNAINELQKQTRLRKGSYMRIKSITYLMYDLVKAV